MPNHKHIVLRSLLIWLVVCFLYACKSVSDKSNSGFVDSGMSPVLIVVAEIHPWKKAQQIAEQVPNSDVMVGHGDAMMPLYPDGTVLVLQKLELDHLGAGMTVVFHTDDTGLYSLRAEVLVRQIEDDRWEIANSEENAEHQFKQLNDENYIGTVVAALARASEEQKMVQREFVVSATNLNCTIQCHIAGQTHPLVVPGLKPKITTFDLSQDK